MNDALLLREAVAGPGEERNADTLFFARRLREAGYRLGPVVVNRLHPFPGDEAAASWRTPVDATDGRALLAWLGERDHHGAAELRRLLPSHPLLALPLLPVEPVDLPSLAALAERLRHELAAVAGR